jgi:sugar phosphate isomerase/epimerase
MGQDGRIVSISTVLFDGYPMARALEEIARSGAKHVEPAFIRGYMDFTEEDFSEIAAGRLGRLAKELGLSIHAVSAHMDLSMDDAVAMLRRRVDFAEALGAQVLITNAGPTILFERIRDTIGVLLPRLERWRGLLALENPGHGRDDLIATAGEGKKLVKAIGSRHIRLNHDAGNVFTYSGEKLDPADDYASGRDVIAHAHLKDVASSQGGWSFCRIGSGDVDLAGYLAVIPPHLPISLELPLRLSRPGRSDPRRRDQPLPIKDLREAVRESLAFVFSNRPNSG